MRRVTAALLVLLAFPALAQRDEIFGNGKPPKYREETMDRRFAKSKFNKALLAGPEVVLPEPGCVQLYGGLFVALAELAPYIHKRDENFTLDPMLQQAIQTQMTLPNFPAMAYLVSMVRRIMIDSRMPDEWLTMATALNKTVKLIDLAKLKMINEHVDAIDSAYYSMPLLKQRYQVEALNVTSAVTTDVVATFRDAYLDRAVTWGGATLLEIGVNQPKGRKKKKYRDAEAEELVAVLQWEPPDPRRTTLDLLAKAPVKIPPVFIYVRLQPKQFADIEKFHRGQRVMVKGQFWEMNKTVTEFEVRDGVIFNDNDWSGGVLLARPEDVATCPVAINELTGLAPQQPGGFAH